MVFKLMYQKCAKVASFIYYEIANLIKQTIHHVDDALTLSKVIADIYIN